MSAIAEQVLPGRNSSQSKTRMVPVIFASSFGTVIEWYDFLIYGTAAALVFNTLFFPKLDPVTGTLASLGTFAVGFFARPIGSVIFGHFGDRLGRKTSLMITMVVMAVGTCIVGLLPTYNQIGIWAPILLVVVRIVQGIGLGGEWGGASVMVLEHAPSNRRGLYGSLVQVGFPLGLVASYGAFALATRIIPPEQFMVWGWRIPFILSIVLLAVGWYVRARLPETPLFEDMKKRNDIARNPFFEAIVKHPKNVLIALALKISEVSWVYILTVFVVVYGTSKLGIPRQVLLNAVFIAAALELITMPFFGWLSDRYGRRILYFFGTLFTVCFAFPLFWLIDTKDPQIILVTIIAALSLGHGTMFGLQSTYFPELFGTRVRYTGASFGFQLSAAIGGGLSPIIATALAERMGGTAGVSTMLIILAAITCVATVFARETRGEPLRA
jgi:MFS transporter, MHS family, shikimate and dehydroshikimate transport protein